MAKVRSPIDGYYVDNRIVFFVCKEFETGNKKNSEDVLEFESVSDISHVGYTGDRIDRIWDKSYNFDFDGMYTPFSVLKIPTDYDYDVRYEDDHEDGGFGVYKPCESSREEAYIVDMEEMKFNRMKFFEVNDDELNKEPDQITTEDVQNVLEKRLDDFKIS